MEQTTLRRALGAGSLTMIGVGNAIGTGIFVLTGVAAANYAGPGIAISYVAAAFICLLTAFCYAELSTMLPEAGGSYTYALLSMGRFAAWMIAWCMALEYLIAASTVAVGWSGYFADFLSQFGVALPATLTVSPYRSGSDGSSAWQASINLPAALLTMGCGLLLTSGVRRSTLINTVIVALKIAVILVVIVFAAPYVQPENWSPFVPENQGEFHRFGWSGIFTATAVAFFSYTGFEALSTAAKETRNPGKNLPLALMASVAICAILYFGMSLIMTGLADYHTLGTASPISTAIRSAAPNQLRWLLTIVNVGTVVGLPSAVFISLYGQSRVFFAMAKEKQAPAIFARINTRGVPGTGALVVGLVASVVAGTFPLVMLGELVSMGCLIAFASVCLSVILLRKKLPNAERPFRVPGGAIIPALGFISCSLLMFSLPNVTWISFGLWLLLGLLLFGSGSWIAQIISSQSKI